MAFTFLKSLILLLLVLMPIAANTGQNLPSFYRPTSPATGGYTKVYPARNTKTYASLTLEPGDVVVPAKREKDWIVLKGRTERGAQKEFWIYAPQAKGGRPSVKELVLKIDPADGDVATIFSEPGKTWRDCTAEVRVKPCIAWPNKTAKLQVIGTELRETYDPLAHEMRWKLFYKVRYAYTPATDKKTRSGEGWINSDDVTGGADPGPAVARRQDDEPECSDSPARKGVRVQDLNAGVIRAERDLLARLLAPKIGQCLLTDGKQLPSMGAGTSAFDQLVLQRWRSSRTIASEIGGRAVSRSELLAIDTLARTLYGEMASCFGRGLQYPEAVAKVVSNRADFIARNPKRKALFAAGDPHPLKSPITEVLTSPYQFSTWNKTHEGRPNPSLKAVLCPPRAKDEKFWTNGYPSSKELKIWQQSVAIAVEAVLYPEAFKLRTSQVREEYYTSGLGFFMAGFVRSHRSIEGKPISRGRCVELWRRVRK